jgi:phage-related protein
MVAGVGGGCSTIIFQFVKNKIVLTHGFTKKEQKTPQKEIEKAKKY